MTSRIDDLLERTRSRLPHRPTASELPDLVQAGAVVIDIRPVGLRDRDGELQGALVVDRNQLEWRLDPTSEFRLAGFDDPDRVVVLMCDEGYASSLAAAALQDLGLPNATDLDGGFQGLVTEWRSRGDLSVGRSGV